MGQACGLDTQPVHAPARPADVHRHYADITKAQDTQQFLISQGATPYVATPEDYRKKFEIALKAWADAVQLAKIETQ